MQVKMSAILLTFSTTNFADVKTAFKKIDHVEDFQQTR